jgi:hypothetical protein
MTRYARISRDVNDIFDLDKIYESIFGPSVPKTYYHPFRREMSGTRFHVDPDTAEQRATDIAMMFAYEEELPEAPPPKFQRPAYRPPKPEPPPKPPKTVSTSAMNSLVERLSESRRPSSPPRPPTSRSISPIPKRKDIPIEVTPVFTRLYERSLAKSGSPPPRPAEDSIPFDDEETVSVTRTLAAKKLVAMIDEAIADRDVLNHEELKELFEFLGVLDRHELIEKCPELRTAIAKWSIGPNLYDVKQIKAVLIQALSGQRGKCRSFLNARMSVHFANRKKKGAPLPVERVRKADKMTQQTFDRLLSPRPDFAVEPEEEPFEPVGLSSGTREILSQSRFGKETVAQRDQHLRERTAARIQESRDRFEREFRENSTRKTQMPVWTDEQRAKIDERKAKKRAMVPEEPPFRPDLMKYAEFVKVKEAMNESVERPKGWDAKVSELRDGCRKREEKRRLSESIQALPEVPQSRRAKSEQRKKKKEQKETEEPPPMPHVEIIEEPVVISKKGARAKTQMASKKPTPPRAAKTTNTPALLSSTTPFKSS